MSNDTTLDVYRVETVVNMDHSMSLLHALFVYVDAGKQFRLCLLQNKFGCPSSVYS